MDKMKFYCHNLGTGYRIPTNSLKQRLRCAIPLIGISPSTSLPEEIFFYFVTKNKIAKLHAQFLGDPSPTDVITFHHGEIFISPEIADTQRLDSKLPLDEELFIYMLHGMLHLCGYDDHDDQGFRIMHLLQQKIARATR